MREHGAVDRLGWRQAVVAVATRLRIALTEIGQQRLPPAPDHFGETDERIELLALHLLEGFRSFALSDPLAELDQVLQAVGHPRVGRLAVAARTPGFLIVGLDRLRQVEVGDEPHVGLVDAHAESDRGDDDDAVVGEEFVLSQRRAPAGRPA